MIGRAAATCFKCGLAVAHSPLHQLLSAAPERSSLLATPCTPPCKPILCFGAGASQYGALARGAPSFPPRYTLGRVHPTSTHPLGRARFLRGSAQTPASIASTRQRWPWKRRGPLVRPGLFPQWCGTQSCSSSLLGARTPHAASSWRCTLRRSQPSALLPAWPRATPFFPLRPL